ncbi:BTB/POZ and MATH domain-containing protein 3 [Dionaea muscipula]
MEHFLGFEQPLFSRPFKPILPPEDLGVQGDTAMLLFIYTDHLPDVEEIMGSESSSSSAIMVQHLLAAADRFTLDRLKLLCEVNLCGELAVDNVATTLSLAELHRCQQLKSICLKFAAAKLGGV